jgi:rhodanese-related sulfurtransferase
VSSARAALLLIDLGFPRARALRGGVSAWRAAGNPLAPLPVPVPVAWGGATVGT